MWFVQARPITATGNLSEGYNLGEPEDLFYWGPSRAMPMYMNDFMAGAERLFLEMAHDPNLPTPPNTLVLFYNGKMVWLNNAKEFTKFTEQTFESYVKLNRLDQDIDKWIKAKSLLQTTKDKHFSNKLIECWYITEFAEFSLYGAEIYISKQLQRFDERSLQKIWGAFTQPDKPSFLNTLDEELVKSKDPVLMAHNYPWIRDGYAGPNDEAVWYFKKRLDAIRQDGLLETLDNQSKRDTLIKEFGLTNHEVAMLTIARRLAEFMDDRKKWMMETRRLITKPIGNIEHGWHFRDGKVSLLNQQDTRELWQRYIDFKSSTSAVVGNVANTGGRHFVSGEVAVLNSHTDPVEDDKILVVPSTSPGWVPLMRRARALVTDHGGMMSHAAIVAREFNLPCIVSTKQGTKVLKDGDKVVLDLLRGEVIK
jgi:phosphohistidine swiveling domain-containing protein